MPRLPLQSCVQVNPTKQKIRILTKVQSINRFVCRAGRMDASSETKYARVERGHRYISIHQISTFLYNALSYI